MTKQQKQELVTRLVEEELCGWQAGYEAGETCALSRLTVTEFEAITALKVPNIKRLRAILRARGDSKQKEMAFWCDLLDTVGSVALQITEHPDFATAFVQRVREVWEEVRDEVLAKLEVLPGRRSDDEPEQKVKVPARSSHRECSGRRTGRRRNIRRRM